MPGAPTSHMTDIPPERWEQTFGTPPVEEPETDDLGRVHVVCAYCHRTDLVFGQECACLARAPRRSGYDCRRCGLGTEHGDLCTGCEYDRNRRRIYAEARAQGLIRG